jgi:uncharacterized phage protein gp47/JayE
VAKTPDVVAKEIIQTLKTTTNNALSLELGTPERKIVDAVAEAISEAYIDQYLVGSLLDVQSKTGLELEQFVGIFGFGRHQGQHAYGLVRIELNNANTQDIIIPNGSQFYTRQSQPGTGEKMYFSSTQTVVIPAGSYVADAPVKCTVAGTSGNVPPDTIVYAGEILGASLVTNLQSFLGGVDVETDEELRQRFKDTLLRNVIGTEDWYLGLCYQNKNVSKAACFGPIRKYATQIQVPTAALSQQQIDAYLTADVKYAWPGDWHVSVFKNLGQDDEVFYRRGVDFNWTAGASPGFARISSGGLVVGDIVDLEFEYTTRSSRNNPSLGITNKVDVYVNGLDPYMVTERTRVSATTFSTDPTAQLYRDNFTRVGTAGDVVATNRFTRLGSVPVASFPSIITVVTGAVDNTGQPVYENYVQGTHFHLVRPARYRNANDTTLLGGSPYEIAGIEWAPPGTTPQSGPDTGTDVTLTYSYNRVPEMIQAVVKTAKQATTDVMVHQAGYVYLRVYLSVEYDRGFVPTQVNNAIQERLRNYFASMPYGAWIEKSDLNLAVHQVLGVDNVRLTESGDPNVDPTGKMLYGIKTFSDSADLNWIGNPHPTTGVPRPYESDFKILDSQLPVFMDAVITRRANR